MPSPVSEMWLTVHCGLNQCFHIIGWCGYNNNNNNNMEISLTLILVFRGEMKEQFVASPLEIVT